VRNIPEFALTAAATFVYLHLMTRVDIFDIFTIFRINKPQVANAINNRIFK